MNMSEIVKILNTGYFGSALGLLGLLAAAITFYASRKRKILVYEYRTQILIRGFENEVDGLEIKYNGNPIKNLATTNIGIWNQGRDPIRREDIAPRDPIAIHFREEIVGDPIILFSKTPASYVSAKKENRKIIVDFDFLDFEDGAIIQVFHTSKLILNLGARPNELIANMGKDKDGFNGYFEDSADPSINSKEELAGIFNNDEYIISGKDFQPFYMTGKVIGAQNEIKQYHGFSIIDVGVTRLFGAVLTFSIAALLSRSSADIIGNFLIEAVDVSQENRFVGVAFDVVKFLASVSVFFGALFIFAKSYVRSRDNNPKVIDKI